MKAENKKVVILLAVAVFLSGCIQQPQNATSEAQDIGQESAQSQYGKCQYEPKDSNVFVGIAGIKKDLVDLNFHIILLKKNETVPEFVSAEGKEGFSGKAKITREFDSDYGDHWIFLEGIVNMQARQDTQRGIIEINYIENGLEKKLTMTCIYPKVEVQK